MKIINQLQDFNMDHHIIHLTHFNKRIFYELI